MVVSMAVDAGLAPVLERPDLAARIRAALDAGSLLLIADAGCGKTTALRAALEQRHGAAAWVRCGHAEGDGGRLLELIVEAIRHALPGAVDVPAERLTTAREPVDPELAAAALGRELGRLLVDPLVVCLDDAETLESGAAALAVTARLIGSADGLLRLALASRRPLAMRLARERAAGRVTVLGHAELAFSAGECESYLRLARGREPLPGEVEELLEETEGWPLGVVLAVAGASPGAPRPAHGLLDDYFEEELLGGLAPEQRREALAAAMAPDLDLAAAAGIGLGAGLGERGLLLTAGGEAGSPVLHPLFRDFLRRRFAAEVPPAESRAVAARLAEALEAAGRGADAVAQRLASEDWEAAADAVAREGGALVRRAPETVDAWLSALPAEQAARPELELLAGQLAHGRGRLGEAVEHCRAAVAGFDANAAPPFMRFGARFALADVLLGSGDLDGTAALAAALDEPEAEGDLSACALGALAAIALALQGRFEEGRALRDRAFADPVAAAIRPSVPGVRRLLRRPPRGQAGRRARPSGGGARRVRARGPVRPPALRGAVQVRDPRRTRRGRRGHGAGHARPRAGPPERAGGVDRHRLVGPASGAAGAAR